MGREAGSPKLTRQPEEARAGLSRREFLAAAAASAVALRSPAGRAARSRGRVVVVGAGLAGLAAAYELERRGWKVVVLEARDRVGGRVLTLRRQFQENQHAEAGGEFVDAWNSTLLGYARSFGLPLEDVRKAPGLKSLVVRNGRKRLRPAVLTPHVRADIDRFWAQVGKLASGLDPEDPAPGGKNLDGRTAKSLLDELELDPTAHWLVEHEIRDAFMVEPAWLSLLFLCQAAKRDAARPDSGRAIFRIKGGNDRLAWALQRRIGGDVVLQSPAYRIEQTKTGVKVNRLEADYCVLTAPVRSWEEIDFVPELPAPLPDAIENIQYGIAAKTLLQYEQRFWRKQGYSGEILTDLKISTTWEATDLQRGERGILAGYSAGGPGLAYSSVGSSTRFLLAADEIDDVFPNTRLLFESGATTTWIGERYSRGSVVAYAPGQVTQYWRALRQPVGRLHFAGDHTDRYSGSMEGALRSGRRAAAEIDARR